MFKAITSLTNPKIKSIVQLRQRRARKNSELTVVEGIRENTRALEAKVEFKSVFICQDYFDQAHKSLLTALNKKKIEIFEVPAKVYEKISYGQRQEGIVSICQAPTHSLNSLRLKKKSVIAIVEGVEKPGNLGAILRSCDGAGVDAVIICAQQTDVYNPNVIRASIGTVFSLNVLTCSNQDVLEFVRANDIKIYSAAPQARTIYTKIKFDDKAAIVVGSEHDGLSDFWKKHADTLVRIPMHGKADSLNVSTSTAILLYEVVRQQEE